MTHLYPLALHMWANPIPENNRDYYWVQYPKHNPLPVLPAVPSTTVPPGWISPFSSKFLIKKRAARSFTDPPGLVRRFRNLMHWQAAEQLRTSWIRPFKIERRRVKINTVFVWITSWTYLCQDIALCFLAELLQSNEGSISNGAVESFYNVFLRYCLGVVPFGFASPSRECAGGTPVGVSEQRGRWIITRWRTDAVGRFRSKEILVLVWTE